MAATTGDSGDGAAPVLEATDAPVTTVQTDASLAVPENSGAFNAMKAPDNPAAQSLLNNGFELDLGGNDSSVQAMSDDPPTFTSKPPELEEGQVPPSSSSDTDSTIVKASNTTIQAEETFTMPPPPAPDRPSESEEEQQQPPVVQV